MVDNVIEVEFINNAYLKINCEVDQSYELKEFFSCYASDYKYHPKYKSKMWNGKVSFYNHHDGLLPIGLLPYLKLFLKKYQYSIKFSFVLNDLRNDISLDQIHTLLNSIFNGVESKGTPIYPRDYQVDAIFAGMAKKMGIIEAATGAGKSIIIYSLIRFIMADVGGNVLLVVPTINLVTQMYSDFYEYGWGDIQEYVHMLYGKSKKININSKVLISTWQSIYKKGQSFFEQFDAVIVDECHSVKSSSLQLILKKCINAEYRIGLTGTLPSELIDQYNIFGFLGRPIYTLKSHTLIERGFLSKIKIVNMYIRYSNTQIKENIRRKYAEEMSFIIDNEDRNKVITHILNNPHVHDGQNVLILAQRISHIDDICEYLSLHHKDKKILKINGKTLPEERERIRKLIETEDNVLLVATYGTLSTGVNIPKLHHVIFSSSYKSKIKVLQSIGRGLRKHSSKSVVIIWDLVDDMRWKKRDGTYGYNYVFKHFIERLKYYKDQKFEYITKSVNLSQLL